MKNKIMVVFILIGGMIVLSSCVTPYALMGTKNFAGGFEDKKIAQGEYAIKIHGNSYTSWEVCEEYFHRRAQELSENKKYKYKLEHTNMRSTQYYSTGITSGFTLHKFPVVYGKIVIIEDDENGELSEDITYLEKWALERN